MFKKLLQAIRTVEAFDLERHEISRRLERIESVLDTHSTRASAVESNLGGLEAQVSREVLKSSGVLAVYAAGTALQPPVPLSFRASNVTVRMVLVYDMPEPAKDAAVQDITRWLEASALTHQTGDHYPLEQLSQAHNAVEGGHIGNVIVDVGTAP